MLHRLALALALSLPLLAAERWTPDDILLTERADTVELSPDARLVVWVKTQMDKEKGESASNLILRHLADGTEVQLTRGRDANTSPRFSPDGKRILFLSTRKPAENPEKAPSTPQLWALSTLGGEPYVLTSIERGVRSFDWIDSDTLLLAAPEDPSLHDQQVKEKKDTSQPVDDEAHAPPVRLFRLDLKTRALTRLTDNPDRITRVVVSPDGNWAVTLHDRSLQYIYNQKVRPATYLHDLRKGTAVQLFSDDRLLPGQVAWTHDSKGFYFSAPFTTHPTLMNASVQRLHRYDLAAARASEVNLDWPNGLYGSFAVTPTGFVALLANGMRPKAAVYTAASNGVTRQLLSTPGIFAVEASRDGRTLLYRQTTASTPSQWHVAALNGDVLADSKPITTLNANWKSKLFSRTEVITWPGAKNEAVEGLLYYPTDYQPNQKRPLVVMIHGGPHGADMDAFSDSWGYPHHLFTQRGAFILKANYHGSSQYGLAWGESISNGQYNELEWIDVEKGVDHLIAKGLVDPQRLGIMGWSNGSIITIEITTRTNRYKAASAGAGDVNWTSDWGNAVFGDSFERYYLGKTPMEDPQLYIRKSPLWRMDKVTTPTAIFFGTEDKQVPTEQGWQHYRALQHYGKADVKFVLFPGEAHGPRKYVHQRRKLDEELAWFDKYLFGTAADLNESLKPGSPLSAAIRRQALGTAPEMVTRGRLEVSRFEVTRAQYAAFDSSYAVAPGTERMPAHNIPFEKAQAYCAWLARSSGKPVRLPSEEEMSSLLKPSKADNTLDAWAGYEVNSDDARRLASQIEGLGPGALLKPVGSHAGNGEDPIYDLGGNVAEWVVTKDGKGKPLGGSADRPADVKSLTPPRPDYTGFRVVRDAS